MTGSITGDITESFFHLSSDHSEHLSSDDENSVNVPDDFSNYLKLARAHDANIRRPYDQADFPSDFSLGSPDSVHRNKEHANKMEPQIQETPRFSLDSNHVTPVAHGRKGHRKNRHKLPPRNQFCEQHEASQTSTLDYNTASFNGDPSVLRDELTGIKGIDVESLFKAFQPLLDEYLRSKKPKEFIPNGPDSDIDSPYDDTFDRPKRSTMARMARPELSSPVTSPPQSSGDSQFCFDKSTEVDDSNVCQPIETQIKKSLLSSNAPQLELGDLTADEIELDFENPKTSLENAKLQAAEAKRDALEEMQLKLEQYKKDNEGMQNEIQFLKCKLDALSTNTNTNTNTNNNTNNTLAKEQESSVLPESVESSSTGKHETDAAEIYKQNLPAEFRPYHDRLQLYKVDQLSDAEKSYLIKNLMLSLLLCNFDNLSKMVPKIGKFASKSLDFLDAIHAIIYPEETMKPSQYLRNYNLEIDTTFTKCLDGMLEQIKEAYAITRDGRIDSN